MVVQDININGTIYKINKLAGHKVPYELSSDDGNKFYLHRHITACDHAQHLLFAVDAYDFVKETPFDGKWFSDLDGKLILRIK